MAEKIEVREEDEEERVLLDFSESIYQGRDFRNVAEMKVELRDYSEKDIDEKAMDDFLEEVRIAN